MAAAWRRRGGGTASATKHAAGAPLRLTQLAPPICTGCTARCRRILRPWAGLLPRERCGPLWAERSPAQLRGASSAPVPQALPAVQAAAAAAAADPALVQSACQRLLSAHFADNDARRRAGYAECGRHVSALGMAPGCRAAWVAGLARAAQGAACWGQPCLAPPPSPPSTQAVPHHARHADQAPRLHAGGHVPRGHAGQRAAGRAGAPLPGPVRVGVGWG